MLLNVQKRMTQSTEILFNWISVYKLEFSMFLFYFAQRIATNVIQYNENKLNFERW